MSHHQTHRWNGRHFVILLATSVLATQAGAQKAAPTRAARKPVPARIATPAPAETNEPKVESLRDAIVAALRENPDIQIALARQDDAKYGIDEARAAYLPRVDVMTGSGPEYFRPPGPNTTTLRRSEATATLHQNIWDFGVTTNDIKRARAVFDGAQWETRGQIEQISFDMASAYLNMLEKQKIVQLIEEEIATQAKLSEMIHTQRELGLTTTADVSRADVRRDNLQQALLDAKSQLEQQRQSYRRLAGHAPGRAIDLPPVDPTLPRTIDDAVGMMENGSPDLAQAYQNRRSIERQLASQNGNFFPKIGLDIQGDYKSDVLGRTGINSDARAVVTLSYNLFRGGADLALKRRIQARLREADYQLDKTRRDVELDLRVDFQSLEAARGKIASIQSEVEAARKVTILYREQFRSGQRSVFDLLDSQQALFQARQNEITNGTQKNISGMRVLQKIGGLFSLISDGTPLPPLTGPKR